MPAKILALDTSSDACSVSLFIGEKIYSLFKITPQKHTEFVLPMLKELLEKAKIELSSLDAIAFGMGPGSFTGIRLVTSITQGLAFGAKLPVIPVSTLRALALRVIEEFQKKYAIVAFDARMQQVYCGIYKKDMNGIVQKVMNDSLIAPEKVTFPNEYNLNDCIGAGSGWDQYGDILLAKCKVSKVVANYYPRAEEIAKIALAEFSKGNFIDPEKAFPLYLRDEVTHQSDAAKS